ncbi:MAG: DUF6265 family protein [Gemmatimonadales bacterium]
MRVTYRFSMILMLAALSGVGVTRNAGDHQAVKAPHWLAGCWQMKVGELTIEEHWMGYRAGSMLGMNRTVRDGQLTGYELLLLHEENGNWTYEARPSGQPPASFVSVALSDTAVVFSNPEHDFPQTITYVRTRLDSLLATIAGDEDGRFREYDFPYQRVSCPDDGGASRR